LDETSSPRKPRKWPVFVIGSSASVAVWSGWVGLGQMCGFGLIHPLPGITLLDLDKFQLNTSITLPIGVEAYGAYALGAWISHGTPKAAKKFAKRSSIGAIGLGMLGQLAYHLLLAARYAEAPWPIITVVSILPVLTLGFAAGLYHLLQQEDEPDVKLKISDLRTAAEIHEQDMRDPEYRRAFEAEDDDRPTPKLEQLLADKPPWEDVADSPVPETIAQPAIPDQQPTYVPADDYDDDLYNERNSTGYTQRPEQSRRPRLDNKVPYDTRQRAAGPNGFSPNGRTRQ
jgi:hypothetical protein